MASLRKPLLALVSLSGLFAGCDFASYSPAPDLTFQAIPVDLAPPPDTATAPDLASPPDMAQPPADAAMPTDGGTTD